MELVIFLIMGLVAGCIANSLMGRRSNSLLLDLGLGIVGAFVGGWLFGLLGFAAWHFPATLISAVIGSMLVIWLVRLLTGQNRRIRY